MLDMTNKFMLVFAMAAMCLSLCFHVASAQEQDDKEDEFGIQLSEREDSIWEFGMRISCQGGDATGIVLTAPIPIPWAEQDIEFIDEIKTDNVGKISSKRLTNEAKMMVIKISRLRNGDSAEAVFRYKVRKSNILPPADTSKLKIAKKVPSKLKTFLKPSPFIESKHKKIRKIAEEIKQASAGLSDWDKVEAIYTWVRENIEYEFDTQNFTCLEALEQGHGDCGELSSLFIAICRAQGIPARLVWIPGHAYPEFFMEDEDGNGHWFPCQAAGARLEFGEMAEARPILQKGDRFRLPLEREPQAYVKPTAFAADDGVGALRIEEWINRKVETVNEEDAAKN